MQPRHRRAAFGRCRLVEPVFEQPFRVASTRSANGHFRKNVFDIGEYGIGKLANSLKLGCDCLPDLVSRLDHSQLGEWIPAGADLGYCHRVIAGFGAAAGADQHDGASRADPEDRPAAGILVEGC
jgi:copper amine oxidase-like protein